jgi:hypothetical protein
MLGYRPTVRRLAQRTQAHSSVAQRKNVSLRLVIEQGRESRVRTSRMDTRPLKHCKAVTAQRYVSS